MKHIIKKVRNIIQNITGEEGYLMSDDFVNDLGLDSLDFIEVIQAVENEFNIKISDNKAEDLTTPGLLVKCIDEKIIKPVKNEGRGLQEILNREPQDGVNKLIQKKELTFIERVKKVWRWNT